MASCLRCRHDTWGEGHDGICSRCWKGYGDLLAVSEHYRLRGLMAHAQATADEAEVYQHTLQRLIRG